MIKIEIGKTDVTFRFLDDPTPVDNMWAMWSLSEKKMVKFSDRARGVLDGSLFLLKRLNEAAMKTHIRECDMLSNEDGTTLKKKYVFKGTAFGRSFNIFSAYAMLLKVGLPDSIKVHNHVIATWTASALERYVLKIQSALV